jgi:Icc-related predicted phosphoesterase
MKILALSDIHQRDFKWSKLASVAKKTKPDAIVIAGDLIVNKFLFKYEEFVEKTIRKYAKEIKTVCPLIIVPGNDDNGELSNYLNEVSGADDLWYNVSDRVVELLGFEFVGVPYVLDHPFGYKYWCVRETNEELKINLNQLCKPLTTVKGKQGYVDIENYPSFLMNKPDMETILKNLSAKVKDMSKAIFLIHCPPIGCGLDITSQGIACGSDSVTKFIMNQQPLLTVHGHIHESPIYTNRWCVNLDKTWSVQAGQVENDLYYVTIKIEDGKVIKLRHSIFGEYKGK